MALATLAMCSCSHPSNGSADSAGSARAWTWRAGPDGSRVYLHQSAAGGIVERCWPRGDDQDCLHVERIDLGDGSSTFTASRFVTARLIASSSDYEDVIGDGYGCQFDDRFANMTETAGATDRPVLKQDLPLTRRLPGARPFTATAIAKALAANDITGRRLHFDCTDLGRHVVARGLGAVATTAIGYRRIMH